MAISLVSRVTDTIAKELPHAGATAAAVYAAHAGAGWFATGAAGAAGALAGLTLALAAEGGRTVWARTLRRQRTRNARAAERIRRAAARATYGYPTRPVRTGLDVVDPADLVDLDSGPFPPASTPAPTVLANGRPPAPLSRS
jgi:hypothetical protein